MLYAGTGEGFFNADAVRGAGLFKTADGGLHRQRQTATATSDFHAVNDLLPSARTRTLYAATGTGVWRSGDTGLTWRRILDPRVQGGCLELALRADQADDVLCDPQRPWLGGDSLWRRGGRGGGDRRKCSR